MRLIVLPAAPSNSDGYGIAVKEDLLRLNINESDIVVFYVTKTIVKDPKYHYINRFSRYSLRRYFNIILNRPSSEISVSDIRKLNLNLCDINYVFCGDVMFYRALRKLFPNKRIDVRFHNCYARIHDRVNLFRLSNKLSFIYRVNLVSFYNLERQIFNDKNTNKLFITDEDFEYYVSNSGRSSDATVWNMVPKIEMLERENCLHSLKTKIVWYGGLDSHKIDSVKWFVSSVFSGIHQSCPDVEFHLFGNKTESFNDPSNGIIGHGYYSGTDMPFKDEAIYINPDLTGGGVKIKLFTYFEKRVVFITTPYGYEGYPKKYIDNCYCYVKEADQWLPFLKNFFAAI